MNRHKAAHDRVTGVIAQYLMLRLERVTFVGLQRLTAHSEKARKPLRCFALLSSGIRHDEHRLLDGAHDCHVDARQTAPDEQVAIDVALVAAIPKAFLFRRTLVRGVVMFQQQRTHQIRIHAQVFALVLRPRRRAVFAVEGKNQRRRIGHSDIRQRLFRLTGDRVWNEIQGDTAHGISLPRRSGHQCPALSTGD